MVDARGRVEYLNPAAVRLLGVEPDQARGRPIDEVAARIGETDRKLLIEPVQQSLSGGAPLVLGRRALMVSVPGDGERLVEMSATALRDEQGRPSAYWCCCTTSPSCVACRTPDVLSGDPRCADRAGQPPRIRAPAASDALEVARRGDGAHVLCYLDLDRFKLINDTSGHQAGDAMLREPAKLLRDAGARLGYRGAPRRR